MAFYLNKKTCIISVPYGEPEKHTLKVASIRLMPGKPELVEGETEVEFLRNAKPMMDEGCIQQITDEEAQEYMQKWEKLKSIPAKAMKDNTDRYLSAIASYARQEARQEGMEIDVKKKTFIPAW